MKIKLYLFLICLSFGSILQAQTNITVNVTAGNLSSIITNDDLSTVTSLTIKGTIDARDFRFMRDKLELVTLLDLSQANIVAYKGSEGTKDYVDMLYPANRIPEFAFRPWETSIKLNLSTVIFPTSLTSIGISAFDGCSHLQSVTIPSSIKKIEVASFRDCISLKSLIIPSTVDTIDHMAFSGCKGLTSVELPSTLSYLGSQAFGFCTGLTSVTIPPSLTTLGSAFAYCTGLTQITIPKSVSVLEFGAFEGCTGLTSVVIPQAVTQIQGYAFSRCTGITSVTIPSQVNSIGENIFSDCTNLTTVSILSPTIQPNNGMFCNCPKINSLKISWTTPPFLYYSSFNLVDRNNCNLQVPYGTSNLYKADNEWNQFKNMTEPSSGLYINATSANVLAAEGSTASVDITANVAWMATSDQSWLTVSPASGTTNRKLTFTAKANLSIGSRTAKVTVTAPELAQQTINITQNSADAIVSDITAGNLKSSFTADQLKTITHLTLKGTIDARDFKTMRDYMPLLAELDLSEVTIAAFNGLYGTNDYYATQYPANTIPEYAFYSVGYGGKSSLNSLILPPTLTGFGQYSLKGCNNLQSLNIPASVNLIGIGAFVECRSLKTLTIPSAVTKIEESTFMACHSLTSVDLPSTITSIGSSAFDGCIALTSIDIPSAVTEIKASTFRNCTGLTSVNIPSTITSIADYAFFNCTGLTSVSLPNSITSIGGAFIKCTGLTTITIPESVTTLGYDAFKECSALKSVTIPAAVTTIGGNAFAYCENLTSVTVLSKNVVMEGGTFSNCNNLATVTINSLSASMDNYVFNACPKLTSITLGCAIPPKCGYFCFDQVNRKLCMLNVPYGSIARYAAASTWKEFINRKEMPGFLLSANTAKVEAREESTATIEISSNVNWTAVSDQSWLSVSPDNGTGTGQKLTFTAQANPDPRQRKATITVSATDVVAQEITITQMPAPLQLEVTPGGLSSALPAEELNAITDLAIKGTIDARDFKTMKDQMPLLAFVDLSAATIAAYNGSEGTSAGSVNYPANEIPENAFYPNSLENPILRAIVFPKSLTSIGYFAFYYCKALTNIEIPSRVTTLKFDAFYNCSALTSVTLPSTITTIEPFCFSYCTKLVSLTVEASIPPDLSTSSQVFEGVNKSLCILKVPYGSAQAYRNASQWSDFQNIIEDSNGFHVSSNNVKVDGTVGSTANVEINANIEWTASTDADWLSLDKTSGTGSSQVITFTAQANPSFVNSRIAYVTIAAPGVNSQNIAVIQSVHPQSPKSWEATPGGLASAFTAEELATIYDLTLTGSIDARDFKTLRDQMPKLAKLDLSGATIVAYQGTEGTAGSEFKSYPGNTVPDYAFLNKEDDYRNNKTLSSLILPQSLTAIGQSSFSYCDALQDVTIPSSLTSIGAFAFNGCRKIEQITIPSLVEEIGVMALGDLNAMITIAPENAHYMISEGVIFNKDQTQLIQCTITKNGSYTIPSTVSTIGDYAFYNCDQLTSATIPSSVTAIGKYAFTDCNGLNSLYAYSTVPVNLESSTYVFSRYYDCVLYVPVGSKAAYQTANQWKNFWYIIEINPDLIADAGPDQQVNEQTVVTLNGSVKVNTSGRRVTYKWMAPQGITLSSDTIANPTFTAPKVSSDTNFTLSLTISDGLDYSAADEVLILVRNVNQLPVAKAGSDQTVNENSWVTLDGSASFDPDNDYLNYEWIATYPILLNSAYSPSATFKAPLVTIDTKYTIFLRVNDGYTYHTDTVVITVKNINQVPTAKAAIVSPVNEGETVTLDARSSIDPDGDVLTYKWTAPEGITLSSTTSATPSFTAPSVESDINFNFTLVVNDGKVNSPTARVDVLVRNVPSFLYLMANVNDEVAKVPVKYQLFMYDGNAFIHKRDTFALNGDTLRLFIEPGYWIGLVSPTSNPSAFVPTWTGNVLNWNDAQVLNIPVNSTAMMHIICTTPQASKTGIGQIAGFVYEKPGDGTKSISITKEESMVINNPVQSALVRLYKKGSTVPAASVFTDSQGYYQFDKLEITDYEIMVELPGFVQSEGFPITLSNTAPSTKVWFAVNTSTQTITDNHAIGLSSVKVYPNPTHGIVYLNGLTGKAIIAVYTMDGKLILKKEASLQDETVDLTNQVAGMYVLVINNQSFKIFKK